MTEGDHDHEFDADARFIETEAGAKKFATYVAGKLNSGWQITAMSLVAGAGGRVFGITVTVRDVVKRQGKMPARSSRA